MPQPSNLVPLAFLAAAVAAGRASGADVRVRLGGRNRTDIPGEASARRRAAARSFPPSRDPFSSVLPLASVPQFVLLTFDDSIGPQAVDLYSPLSSVRSPRDGCPITATWYVSVAANNDAAPLTECELVSAVRRGGHEIATHTYGHTGDPSAGDIARAAEWLNGTCGVPREEMRGFRTPNLAFTQKTFDRLRRLGFLYDSSIAGGDGADDGGRRRTWPYTMDGGIAQDCGASAGSCDRSKSNPGLWEVPMWSMYDAEDRPMVPMDWPGDAYDTLTRNFDRRYRKGGNRAPLGIYLHAAWLSTHGDELRRWAQDVLAEHDDVHFVTNYELIRWMSDPVPSEEYRRDCDGLAPECLPPPIAEGGCGHGTFDAETCACVCEPPYVGRNCMAVNHAAPDGGEGSRDGDRPQEIVPAPDPTPTPTIAPTDAPTKVPTAAPTERPTMAPTEAPTTPPTGGPTMAPTEAPTTLPTGGPTKAPTNAPAATSTTAPTLAPTTSPGTADSPTELLSRPLSPRDVANAEEDAAAASCAAMPRSLPLTAAAATLTLLLFL